MQYNTIHESLPISELSAPNEPFFNGLRTGEKWRISIPDPDADQKCP